MGLMGPGKDPYGPGPGPLWALWARAGTLMGPMGPGQDPYGLQQKSPPRAKLFGAGVIVPWAFLFRRIYFRTKESGYLVVLW